MCVCERVCVEWCMAGMAPVGLDPLLLSLVSVKDDSRERDCMDVCVRERGGGERVVGGSYGLLVVWLSCCLCACICVRLC